MRVALVPAFAACVLAFFANSVSAATFEEECEARLAPTTVSVTSDALSYSVDNTPSIGDLTRRAPLGDPSWFTLGLTTSRRLTSFKFNFETLTDSQTHRTCLRPRFTIAITQNPQLVSVGRELRPGTCEYNAVLTHELKHVEANHSHTTRVAKFFKAEMETAFGNTVFYGDREALRLDLTRTLEQAWQPRLQSLLEQVNQLHARIDTPEEYAHSSVVCDGVIPKILKASGYLKQ